MAMFDEKGLFLRDLSEVHLLFDFISGRAGKSLDQLGGTFRFDLRGKREEPLTSEEVVEEICKIRYPPEGKLEANAEQAAFMVVVKDKLNDLAFPARGLTIAFTSMFAGTALEPHTLCEYLASAWCFDLPVKGKKRVITAASGRQPPPPLDDAEEAPDRSDAQLDPSWTPGRQRIPDEQKSSYTAVLAFPNLERQARIFRRYYNRVPCWGILLVVLIAFISWDCSVTTALMSNIATAARERDALLSSDNRFTPTTAHCATASQPQSSDATTASKTTADEDAETRYARVCDKQKKLYKQELSARENLRAIATTRAWFHPVALGVTLYTRASLLLVGGPKDESTADDDTTLENNFSAVLATFNTILTPLLFGWLGTLVAVARSITSKVRDSILAPRDYQIARVSTFLGMSAGLTVGLFYTSTDATGVLTKSLGGTIPVSAATLSFLAGLGAEAFFTFLDSVISRLFPASPPPLKDAPPQKSA